MFGYRSLTTWLNALLPKVFPSSELLPAISSFVRSISPILVKILLNIVKVNGVEVSEWDFDQVSRTIKFDVNHIPQEGASIEISYDTVVP